MLKFINDNLFQKDEIGQSTAEAFAARNGTDYVVGTTANALCTNYKAFEQYITFKYNIQLFFL